MLFQWQLLPMLIAVSAQQPPALNVTLKPSFDGNNVSTLAVRLAIENPLVLANQTLAKLSLILLGGNPSQQYSGDAILASDDKGKLLLGTVDSEGNRSYITPRPTVGDVVLNFTAQPSAKALFGPSYDLVFEKDKSGASGMGMNFFPQLMGSNYTINVDWDLAAAPPGMRAVSSYGENATSKVGSTDVLANAYFAWGKLKSFPEAGVKSNFSMYWFTEPKTFSNTELANWTQQLFLKSQKFFHDTGDAYRVFTRYSEIPSNLTYHLNGAAHPPSRSFLYGYDDTVTPTQLHTHLAHEMVHNWADMTGSVANITWYLEGTADYYSAKLPFRFGLQTTDGFLDFMNGLARDYYTNPFINLTNEAWANAADPSGHALFALAYNRGAMFFVHLDTLIREKSNGTRSVDDAVVPLLARKQGGRSYSLDDFLSILDQVLGPQGRQEVKDMANAKLIIPRENSLGPCFSVVQTRFPVRLPTQWDSSDQAKGNQTLSNSTMAVGYQWVKKPGVNDSNCLS